MVLDFAVNDGHISPPGRDKYGYSFTGAPRRGFEQLVRRPAVLLPWHCWLCRRGLLRRIRTKKGGRGWGRRMVRVIGAGLQRREAEQRAPLTGSTAPHCRCARA